MRLHRNAQRLLRPVDVVDRVLEGAPLPGHHDADAARPHEVPDADPGDRAACISISARSRPAREDGETLEYIEATEADVKLAWELASHVLMRSLDDVPPQTRRLLLLIDKMVTASASGSQIERLDYRFTRATVRQFTRLGRLAAKETSAPAGGAGIPGAASRRGRPELRLRAQLRDGRERQAGCARPGSSYGANRSRSEEGLRGVSPVRSRPSHGGVAGGHDA